MSQFAFLQPDVTAVFDAASWAETAVHADPRTACFYARRALALAVAWAFKHDAALKLPYQDNLSAPADLAGLCISGRPDRLSWDRSASGRRRRVRCCFNVISPGLHHLAALFHVLGTVVHPAHGVRGFVSELLFDNV